MNLKKFCYNSYEKIYNNLLNKNKNLPIDKIEVFAQKEAIKDTIIDALENFNDTETETIWKTLYEIHIHRKSGIDDFDIIHKVISADQSWKKSSGHAFEEMIKLLGNKALNSSNIEIILQRDLNILIKTGKLDNEPRDICWLKEHINANIFDLYILINQNDKKYCYGCIQSKTSIRDRVTRDREPSIAAMKSFFWSTIFVLDGSFLKPKFISMVNGGSSEYPTNGWHGMYVFSKKDENNRIYPTNTAFLNFKEHALEAANFWLKQRQWFDSEWKAGEKLKLKK